MKRTVWKMLAHVGLQQTQANRKTNEGKEHTHRNEQNDHIEQTVQQFQQREQPVISVDAKKKELVGEYLNVRQEWQPPGEPIQVLVHDFADKNLGALVPYGVYDQAPKPRVGKRRR